MEKKQLGQFFTKNSDYILQNLEKYIRGKEVIDPFAGSGDLIEWAKKNKAKKISGFDIDKKFTNIGYIFCNDSILNPKRYEFVLTNPPYLNINKASQETKEKYFSKYQLEDLYQISLASIMNSQEGIIIVPINFLSAENSKRIRDLFFSKFKIVEMNYFKQQVFPDTTYNVIAFYYTRKNDYSSKFRIEAHIYPDNNLINISLDKNYGWTIGGEFLNKIKNQKNNLGIHRLTEKDIEDGKGGIRIKAAFNHINEKFNVEISSKLHGQIKSNILLLKAIDSGSDDGRIALEDIRTYNVDCLISKPTSRNMIYLLSDEKWQLGEQKEIIKLFNSEINLLRDNYMSLFLTNFRDNDRKRISFDFVYKFINYLYSTKIKNSRIQTLYS